MNKKYRTIQNSADENLVIGAGENINKINWKLTNNSIAISAKLTFFSLKKKVEKKIKAKITFVRSNEVSLTLILNT